MKLYSYYFPNWHADARNDLWHGKGWTEWEVTKCARARFEGHHQPLIPTWGYLDESDPKVMEKKIECAKKYGIDGFIFDTYYYDDGPYRLKCLDEGFLKARNSSDFEFSILWCNHDAIYSHPSPRIGIAPTLKSGSVTSEDFKRITNVFIGKYFVLPNYTRIDGKILFSIYNVNKLINELGGLKKCQEAFADLRDRVRKAGLGELCIATVSAIMEDVFDTQEQINDVLDKLSIDLSLRYWWTVKFSDKRLTMDYSDFAKNGLEDTKRDYKTCSIPSIAHIMSGLDQSPRTIQSEMYENMNIYPWYTVITGCTPKKFEDAFRNLRRIAKEDGRAPFMTCIWNEWTEGNYLEPEKKYGYKYLKAIRKVIKEDK